jgi:DNA-directed RNA polymerase specialized sigma24 family protein
MKITDVKGDLTEIQQEYLCELYRSLKRIYGESKRNQHGEVDDIISYLIVRSTENLPSVIQAHPCASDFARMIHKNGAIDYSRRQAVSRGEGARRNRKIESLFSKNSKDGANYDVVIPDFSNDDYQLVNSRIDSSIELNHAYSQMSDLVKRFLYLTVIEGLTQECAATILGFDRSYLSKRLKSESAKVQKTFGAAS